MSQSCCGLILNPIADAPALPSGSCSSVSIAFIIPNLFPVVRRCSWPKYADDELRFGDAKKQRRRNWRYESGFHEPPIHHHMLASAAAQMKTTIRGCVEWYLFGPASTGVPSLAIYCAVFIFLGAPLVAAIMFAYMAIVLIDLIAFGMTGRGFCTVSAFSDTLADDCVSSAGDYFGRANGFCHACGVGAFNSVRRARSLWTENGETLLCRLRRRALDSAHSCRTTPLIPSTFSIRAGSPL